MRQRQAAPNLSVRLLRIAAYACLAALLANHVVKAGFGRNCWDFQVYYYAARAWSQGLDPYDLQALRAVGYTQKLRFAYPVAAMALFRPLSELPITTAAELWFGLKAAALATLVALWRRRFVPDVDPLLLGAVVLLGFNQATMVDLRAGNRIAVEHLLLWAGFACYLRERLALSAACIALGAIFNLTPIVLLCLLFVTSANLKRSVGAAALGVGIFLVVAGGPYLARPELAGSYLTAITSIVEVGWHNPCARAFISEHLIAAVPSWLLVVPSLETKLFVLYVILVLGLGLPPLARAARRQDRVAVLMIALILYALVMPRFKIYSYMLLMVPALWAYRVVPAPKMLPMFLALALCFPATDWAAGCVLSRFVPSYFPWFLALGLWLMCVLGWTDPPAQDVVSDATRTGSSP